MKKYIFLLAFAVILLQGCNSSEAKDRGEKKAIPAETVSQETKADGGTIKLTKEVFLDEVWDFNESPKEWKFKGDKPAVIDFYADWCGPCKIASPILEEISKEYAGKVDVYKLDTEAERELASAFGIRGIPAFLYIPKEGQPFMTSGIARTKEETKQMFKDNIDKILLTSN